jgi:hypothetical protein
MSKILNLHMAMVTICAFHVKVKLKQYFKTFYLLYSAVSEQLYE